MSKLEYAPLRFSKHFNLDSIREILGVGFKRFPLSDHILNAGVLEDVKNLEPDLLLQMAFSLDFLTLHYRGPFALLNKGLCQNRQLNMALFEGKNLREEWKDLFSMAAMVELFRQHKQVYVFDPDFVSDLSKTDGIKFYPSLLRRLPYNTFYLDFSQIKEFRPFDGMFVHVDVGEDNSVLLLGYRTFRDIYYSCNARLTEKEQVTDGNMVYYDYKRSLLKYRNEVPLSDSIRKDSGIAPDFVLSNDSFPDIWMFLVQALMYLASREPDVEENPKTRKTYRKSDKVQDKFSEVRQWDVGVRYGTKIRKIKKEAVIEEGDPDGKLSVSVKTRKSPRPHSRCAHWQHYWTGPGRTVLELKWIEPTFVGVASDIPVVKHMVNYPEGRVQYPRGQASGIMGATKN